MPELTHVRSHPVWICPVCWTLKLYRKQPAKPHRCMRCAKARYRPLTDMVDECGVDREAAEAAYRLGGTEAMRDMIYAAWDEYSHLQKCDDDRIGGGCPSSAV